MAVKIVDTEKNSIAMRSGIAKGDILLKIDGQEIVDYFDYQFYISEENVCLTIERENKIIEIKISKDRYQDIGLVFESFLMDGHRRCHNNCIFCFIDQLPTGLRKPLYFKDDDSRLSYLFGNYVTLTNMTRKEAERIVKMKISPINISVHTTNKQLREKMMGSKKAGNSLDLISYFAENGVSINGQIVLCPGFNDGDELISTVKELYSYYPAFSSLCIVPVGLSGHREGLCKLKAVDKEVALRTINDINKLTEQFRESDGVSFCYLADEFYLKAGIPIPPEESYDGYPQLDNGVGMMREFYEDIIFELSEMEEPTEKISIDIATGTITGEYICGIMEEITKRWKNLSYKVHVVENRVFGGDVSVTGLLCGGDIIEQIKGKMHSNRLLLSADTLSNDRIFLDDVTPCEMEKALSAKVLFNEVSGRDFLLKLKEI